MDFDFSEEQNILKKSARTFLTRELPRTRVREIVAGEAGYSDEIWNKMAELGWMGLIFPETYGGFDGASLDLVLILEEMGANLCPGPFLPTVAAGLAVLAAGTEDQKAGLLPELAAGSTRAAIALTEPMTRGPASLTRIGAKADGGDWVIDTVKVFVPYAHVADWLLCVCRTAEDDDPEAGLTIFRVDRETPGLTLTPLENMANEKLYEAAFDQVRLPASAVIGEVGRGGPAIRDAFDRAALGRAAEIVGGAQAAMDMAMQYAGERVQFNRPIGSFPAVQKHFADMYMLISGARQLVYQAAWKIDRGLPARKAIALAKAHAGRTGRRVTTLGHQVFAAISFTMEHDMHLYYRQALAGDLAYGNSDYQRQVAARELGL
ncbi:MAG: acyl-CoA/acyl-ACP dehydrogenase [Proteobacteria bacterium]|nr:acyl-CoA/acyl-ACP dehydrogenase [Pseudomonadota bacterium]